MISQSMFDYAVNVFEINLIAVEFRNLKWFRTSWTLVPKPMIL